MAEVAEGSRVVALDLRRYFADRESPDCMRPATVVRRYIYTSRRYGWSDDVVDVVFDHRPDKVSRAHFVSHLLPLEAPDGA